MWKYLHSEKRSLAVLVLYDCLHVYLLQITHKQCLIIISLTVPTIGKGMVNSCFSIKKWLYNKVTECSTKGVCS